MTDAQLLALKERLLDAWNRQDVEGVLACCTDDVVYRDPNTRGEVRGLDAMRRYLRKLFAAWNMHWEVRESFRLATADGVAALWRASFRRPGGQRTVYADGMDLVLVEGERVTRNEVYFDRAVLAALAGD
ncbi:MAG TPA: nuclear transport factor 2 family protein [Candidatus Dormibacteraeota bacterium]|nr:nuclear transport factor 2 family protein [Candidatus Dormibacteraeota bacterium]